MNSLNPSQNHKPYFLTDVSTNGRETYELYQKMNKTLLDSSYDISQYWDLQKTSLIRNSVFEMEFDDKSKEIECQTSYPEHYEVRYGFLATIKEEIIDQISKAGLEVKMCPYNYLGYNIAGVHISQHADVCLNEAKSKIGPGDNLVLIIFQYMLGKRKIVPMHDQKFLLAPTPRFDSHICEERPDPKEKDSLQYIKSLVYLYEFADNNLEPVIRPRHCCPMAAMIFKNRPFYETIGGGRSAPIGCGGGSMATAAITTGHPDSSSISTSGNGGSITAPYSSSSSFSFLKPVSQYDLSSSHNRTQHHSNQNAHQHQMPPHHNSYSTLMTEYKKPSLGLSTNIEEESSNLKYEVPKGMSRNNDSMILMSDRERSPSRNKKAYDSTSSDTSKQNRSFDRSRRPNRSSKGWMK